MTTNSEKINGFRHLVKLLGIKSSIEVIESYEGCCRKGDKVSIDFNEIYEVGINNRIYCLPLGNVPIEDFVFLHELAHFLTAKVYSDYEWIYSLDRYKLNDINNLISVELSHQLYRLIPFERIADNLALKLYNVLNENNNNLINEDVEKLTSDFIDNHYEDYKTEFNDKISEIMQNVDNKIYEIMQNNKLK